ncbi:2-hydroxyacid dehydrogenase [Paucibacter sp. R3-3]|uniref:2-hydroxyacid dehydrogenase n=1 Tax=Roseateles agri TaxID=3098619 RepID=A0ABU5DRP1_9BURK|nr:2-hydroxyacid dehydrogenase [Paucibacter sp. R3-3]MDY0748991.1 2-hydroxyacid dehydrogenase [Paucibacter sp. R3-3]
MKPVLLLMIPLRDQLLAQLRERFDVRHAPTQVEREAIVRSHGEEIEIVLTNGTIGISADQIDAMPRLTFACAYGAGYENIAVEHARSRGIALANGAGSNEDCVADHALALLLSAVRAIPTLDSACRQGVWRDDLPLFPQLAHKRVGILGLGSIGRKIARRCEAFDMSVGYHNRSKRSDLPYAYFGDAEALANWSDFLIVAAPGGAATRHIVNSVVLAALGSDGFLVNISRGSLVDTAALAEALSAGGLRGAGLDVYEGEPDPPAALIGLRNVVLTPHVAGSSPEALQAALACFMDNAARHLAGEPLRTPI